MIVQGDDCNPRSPSIVASPLPPKSHSPPLPLVPEMRREERQENEKENKEKENKEMGNKEMGSQGWILMTNSLALATKMQRITVPPNSSPLSHTVSRSI